MIDIKVPELPESVDEATLLAWDKQDGDFVEGDDKIAEVETDKVVLEVFATKSGVLKILAEEGSILKRGDLVARIDTDGKGGATSAEPAKDAAASAEEEAVPAEREEEIGSDGLSPSVRRLLTEKGLSAEGVKGTGKGGRITKQDVEAASAPTKAPAPAPVAAAPVAAAPQRLNVVEADVRRVPMSQIRRRIATRLKDVQNTAAILTTFNEVNMKPVMDLRTKYKDRFTNEHGVKLGFMSFFVKATVEALKKYPDVNAMIDDRDIIYNERFHIGIAVDSPRGLVVPVLRDVDTMSFAGVERTIRDLAGRAQESKLTYEELVGGTFTITNGGVFGSMLSTPILNAPQSAILGMHTIQQRAVVEDGEIVARPMMYLALSYDHRIVDGRSAVQFLVSIKEALEDPNQLLLEI
jgi:2-oxoglutarate dehydrogenase E2 component (dihydrolipoamide succinyltransferase)